MKGLLRAHGPHLLLGYGFVRALLVGALAPVFGIPLWLALVLAGLWMGGPAIGSVVWQGRRARKAVDLARPRPV